MSKSEKAKVILHALAWGTGGKKGRCDTLLHHLRTHKATLSLGLTTELSHDIKRIDSNVAEVKTTVNIMQVKLDREWHFGEPPSLIALGPLTIYSCRGPTSRGSQMA